MTSRWGAYRNGGSHDKHSVPTSCGQFIRPSVHHHTPQNVIKYFIPHIPHFTTSTLSPPLPWSPPFVCPMIRLPLLFCQGLMNYEAQLQFAPVGSSERGDSRGYFTGISVVGMNTHIYTKCSKSFEHQLAIAIRNRVNMFRSFLLGACTVYFMATRIDLGYFICSIDTGVVQAIERTL